MNLENYKTEDAIINLGAAQIISFGYFLPFAFLFGIPYYWVWKNSLALEIQAQKDIIHSFGHFYVFVILAVILIGIILHEFIHGLTWSQFAKNGLKSMKYGILWKHITPYCHCKEPLSVQHYIIGVLMPGIILGFLPCILAILTGNLMLLEFGLFFTYAAGGDFMIFNLIRKESKGTLVQDHPSEAGCILYKKK